MKVLILSLPAILWLADVDPTGQWGVWIELLKACAITGICFFVIARIEPQLKANTMATYDLARIISVMLAEMPHVVDAVKRQALETLAKAEEIKRQQEKK